MAQQHLPHFHLTRSTRVLRKIINMLRRGRQTHTPLIMDCDVRRKISSTVTGAPAACTYHIVFYKSKFENYNAIPQRSEH